MISILLIYIYIVDMLINSVYRQRRLYIVSFPEVVLVLLLPVLTTIRDSSTVLLFKDSLLLLTWQVNLCRV